MAANVTLPVTLTNGTPNDASQVMSDLNALVTWINTNAVHLDGSKAMTGTLSGPAGVDPVSADQYSRKAYVDAQIAATAASALTAGPGRTGCQVTRNAAQVVGSGVSANISYDTEVWDSSTFFPAPPSTTITIRTTGLYIIHHHFVTDSFGNVWLEGQVNGALRGVELGATGISDGHTYLTQTFVEYLTVGDTVTVLVFQNSGSNKNFTGRTTVQKIGSSVLV